jgi:hypothetical protein
VVSAKVVLEELAAKNFESLVGVSEGVWLEAKQSPYVFETPKQ